MKQFKDLKIGQSATVGNCKNPKLKGKCLAAGKVSLYLEYNFGQKRTKSALGLTLFQKPNNPIEKQQNKDTLELAERIAFERGQEMLKQERGYRVPRRRRLNFLALLGEFVEGCRDTLRSPDNMKRMQRYFLDFLDKTDEYKAYYKAGSLDPLAIDCDMIETFCEYLKSRCKGEGALTIYKRFKTAFRRIAYKNGFNAETPFITKAGKRITITVDDSVIAKDVLNAAELGMLARTHFKGENEEVRKAFLFSLHTGMRYVDVCSLTFGNIDYSNAVVTFNQMKTTGNSKHSWVTVPLSDDILALIGRGEKEEKVFRLPTNKTCNKYLEQWTAAAGIEKHITWHCARHTVGTLLATIAAEKGLSQQVIMDTLGHTSMRMTERYIRVVDRQKREAIEALSALSATKEDGAGE